MNDKFENIPFVRGLWCGIPGWKESMADDVVEFLSWVDSMAQAADETSAACLVLKIRETVSFAEQARVSANSEKRSLLIEKAYSSS